MSGKIRNSLNKRLTSLFASLLLVAAQASFALAPFISIPKVAAAEVCVVDTAGANDEPNQKDLTKLCVDEAGLPSTIETTWNWDEKSNSGNNSMDGCALFDTDNDGNVNYAVCVTTKNQGSGQNQIAVFDTLTTYSCGDNKVDRCTQALNAVPNGSTSCTVSQQNTDPFPSGDESPLDTVADCTISTANIGGADAELVDVCSYPSQQPNSDPSDCVIIQDKSGKLEVVKNLVPSSDSGLFNLQVDGATEAANVGDDGTTGEVVVDEGDHDVGETAGTNTSLASYTSSVECRNLNGTGSVVASGSGATLADVPVADGSDIVCIITNTAASSITIVKDAVPNDAQDFTFTASGTGVSDFTLDDDGNNANGTVNTKTFNNLGAGTYTFNEDSVNGWYLDGIDCPNFDETQSVENRSVSLTVTAGQNVTCTFTNRKLGQVQVTKQTDPANDPQVFSITATGTNTISGDATRDIVDDETETFVVRHGTYDVTETLPAGWSKDDSQCQDLVINGNTAQVNGVPTASCTIFNTKLATLNIVKDALPNHEQDFTFSVSNLPGGNFNLDDDDDNTLSNQKTFSDLTPGQNYSVTEQALGGWQLTGLECNDVDQQGSTASVTPTAGQTVTCTFTNTKLVSISGTKYTADADGSLGPVLSGWTIFIDSNNNGELDPEEQSALTDENGDYSFDNILYGTTVVLREVLMSGWTQIFGPDSFNVDSASDITDKDFGNFENASISGFKWNDEDADDIKDAEEDKLSGWTITLKDNQDNVLDSKVTDGSGNYSFTNLAPGTYVVCETQQSGWVQTYPNDNACHTIIVDESGETNEANFGNQGRGSILVQKNVDTDGDGQIDETNVSNWTWDIDDGAQNTATGTSQNVAAGTYTVREDQQDGYHVTSVVCDTQVNDVRESAEVVVGPGDSVTCTFTNTRDTGTIEVRKEIEPEDDEGLFDLQINGATEKENASDGDTTGAVLAVTGEYSVGEIAGDDTSLDDYFTTAVCTKNGQELEDFTLTSPTLLDDITVETDDVIVCTFTNVRYGKIIVEKQTQAHEEDDTSFEFDTNYGDNFFLKDGESNNSDNLLPGTYSVEEILPTTGWDLDSATCDDQSDPSDISLQAGETVTCTFINIQRGGITGTKYEVDANATDGTNGSALEGWTIFIDEDDDGELDLGEVSDDTDSLGAYSFENLVPGDYVVCEVLKPGWTQIFPAGKPGCHDVTLEPGETDEGNDFGNFRNGSIEGYKFNDLNGDGDDEDGTDPRLENWHIILKEGDDIVDDTYTDSNGDFSFTNLDPGTYTVCEELKDDWQQTTTPLCHPFTIETSDQNETTAIFGNQGLGTITVNKVIVSSEEDDGLFNLQINGTNYAENVGDGGSTGEQTVPVGTYNVSETAGTETDLSDYDTTYECVKNQESVIASGENATTVTDLQLGLGDDVVCTFTNTRHGELVVIKDANPNDAQDFHFTINELEKAFDLDDDEDEELSNSESTEVSSGIYTITEDSVEGWDLADVDCGEIQFSENGNGAQVLVQPGATVTCTFLNEKRAEVKVTKYNDFDRDGEKDENEPTLSGWDFTLASEECTFSILFFNISVPCSDIVCQIFTCQALTVTQTTGEDGTTTFTNVKPKQEYGLSETLQDGWFLSNIDCGEEEQIERIDQQEDTLVIEPQPGETVECFVGNYRDAVLVLEKTNNKPDPTSVGDTVTYTLTATVPEDSNPVYGVQVKDLLPENFEYVAGTASASQGSLTETYASPGTWTLGDIFPGQSVTMTYQAVIAGLVSAGTYPDLAFAVGANTPVDGQIVYSNVHQADSPFVGTEVTVAGEVLGATVLVNTGSRIMALQLALPILVIIAVTALDIRQKKGAKA